MIKLAVAFAVLAAGATGLSAPASAATKAPAGVFDTKAKHAILMNVDADLIFYEKDADTLMSPASMSKLMTLAVVFRELKAGHIKLDDQFKVSEHAWRDRRCAVRKLGHVRAAQLDGQRRGSDPGRHRAVRQRRLHHPGREESPARKTPSPRR